MDPDPELASSMTGRQREGLIEINVDLLDEESKTGAYFTGHLTKEGYLLFGFVPHSRLRSACRYYSWD